MIRIPDICSRGHVTARYFPLHHPFQISPFSTSIVQVTHLGGDLPGTVQARRLLTSPDKWYTAEFPRVEYAASETLRSPVSVICLDNKRYKEKYLILRRGHIQAINPLKASVIWNSLEPKSPGFLDNPLECMDLTKASKVFVTSH